MLKQWGKHRTKYGWNIDDFLWKYDIFHKYHMDIIWNILIFMGKSSYKYGNYMEMIWNISIIIHGNNDLKQGRILMPWNTRALSSTTKSAYNDETLLSLSPKKKAMPQLTRTSRQLRHRLHFWFGRCPHETLQNPSGCFELSMSFYVASSKCHPMPAFFAQCSWCAIVMRLSCFQKK